MNKDQILARLEQIKKEERELKAMLRKLEGKPTREPKKRPEPIVSGDSAFMRMANKMVYGKRWEA
jgi:hypothetical protein